MRLKQKLVPYIHNGSPTDLFMDPVSEVLYHNKKIAGKRHKFSTFLKKEDFFKARAFALKELKARMQDKVKIEVASLITDELDHYYLVKKSEGLQPDTMKNIRNAIKQIRPYWGTMFPSEITSDTLPGWYLWFLDAYPGQQMENAIKYMRNFCHYMNKKIVGGIPVLPAIPTIRDPNHKKVRRDRKRRKSNIFTADEFDRVFAAASSLQERVLCLFMYTMATRVSETLDLSFGDEVRMNVAPPEYRWRDGQNKADHDGRHALHPQLLPLLEQLKELRDSENTRRLFPQERDPSKRLHEQQINWDGWRDRAGLDWHWTSHTFRHTCLSNLFNDESFPQALICKLYRVSLAVALETYVKPTLGGIMKMRSAIKVNISAHK